MTYRLIQRLGMDGCKLGIPTDVDDTLRCIPALADNQTDVAVKRDGGGLDVELVYDFEDGPIPVAGPVTTLADRKVGDEVFAEVGNQPDRQRRTWIRCRVVK